MIRRNSTAWRLGLRASLSAMISFATACGAVRPQLPPPESLFVHVPEPDLPDAPVFEVQPDHCPSVDRIDSGEPLPDVLGADDGVSDCAAVLVPITTYADLLHTETERDYLLTYGAQAARGAEFNAQSGALEIHMLRQDLIDERAEARRQRTRATAIEIIVLTVAVGALGTGVGLAVGR